MGKKIIYENVFKLIKELYFVPNSLELRKAYFYKLLSFKGKEENTKIETKEEITINSEIQIKKTNKEITKEETIDLAKNLLKKNKFNAIIKKGSLVSNSGVLNVLINKDEINLFILTLSVYYDCEIKINYKIDRKKRTINKYDYKYLFLLGSILNNKEPERSMFSLMVESKK